MALPLLLLFAYLLGSIPFGWIVAHYQGVDIQKRGSGNIGFANVRRVLGWRAGILTLIGDIAKGLIPTYTAIVVLDSFEFAFLVGIAAIFGHIFPIWLRGRGGKGIATGLGVVIALSPIAALVGSIVYILSAVIIKKSSTASIIGIVVMASVACFIQPSTWYFYVILCGIAGWTLRKNIIGTVPSYDI